MTCETCGKEGKRFTMHPSKKRLGFMEHLCQKCSRLRTYEDARLEEAKKLRINSRHA